MSCKLWIRAGLMAPCALWALPAAGQDKLRVIIETDLGGDADDQASLVRFLLYTNEWDVEGIIADRPAGRFHSDGARDHKGLAVKNGYEMALAYLDAYGQVYENLRRHAEGYPSPQQLRSVTVPGWNETEAGVKRILAAGDSSDPRPIWYGNWAATAAPPATFAGRSTT